MTLDELRHGAGAAPSFVHGDTAQSSERAGRGPLTTRPCVCMGNGFFPNRPNAGAQLAVFSKRQYLPRPERGGGQVLFFEGPWPGSEGAALCRRSCFLRLPKCRQESAP
jgi:hypothetical protein